MTEQMLWNRIDPKCSLDIHTEKLNYFEATHHLR